MLEGVDSVQKNCVHFSFTLKVVLLFVTRKFCIYPRQYFHLRCTKFDKHCHTFGEKALNFIYLVHKHKLHRSVKYKKNVSLFTLHLTYIVVCKIRHVVLCLYKFTCCWYILHLAAWQISSTPPRPCRHVRFQTSTSHSLKLHLIRRSLQKLSDGEKY